METLTLEEHHLRGLEEMDKVRTYQRCENCGFKLKVVLPPTKATAPFPVEICPICGRRRDDHGFYAGARLSPQAKREAFIRWLATQGLNEEILYSHYHLSMDDFFED